MVLLVLLTDKRAYVRSPFYKVSGLDLLLYIDGKELNEIVNPITLSEGGSEEEQQLQAFLQLALKYASNRNKKIVQK